MAFAEELFDAEIRHAIGIRRFMGSEVKRVLELLDQSDAELTAMLRRELKQGTPFKSARMRQLQKDIRALRRELWKTVRATDKSEMLALSKAEQEFVKRTFEAMIPVSIEYATVSAEMLNALVVSKPFAGGANAARTLHQWWSGLERADATRVMESLQMGMVQGETVDQMVSRVRKTLPLTRRNAEAVVRTATNHVTNAVRGAFHQANEDILSAVRWSAVLDGRTSAICRARDGHYAPVSGTDYTGVPKPHLHPPTARPPAHPNCRSQMTAVLDDDGVAEKIGTRAFVRDVRTRRKREIDFRAQAHEAAGDKKWKRWTVKQRNAAIKRQRLSWTKENIGTVRADVSYDQWLRRQSTAFQNEVLGVAKGRAFRKGLKLDQFVDRRGSELTLLELKEKFPSYLGG